MSTITFRFVIFYDPVCKGYAKIHTLPTLKRKCVGILESAKIQYDKIFIICVNKSALESSETETVVSTLKLKLEMHIARKVYSKLEYWDLVHLNTCGLDSYQNRTF